MGKATKGNILIVDDHPSSQFVMEAVLECLGLNIVAASSGEEALRLLLEREFDLIVMDFTLPGINGLETAQLIRKRERNRTIPIIFLTGSAKMDDDLIMAHDLSYVCYLIKPVTPERLREQVSLYLPQMQH